MLPRNLAPNVVARLKVLSQLLTYQTDVPQEGRIHQVEGDAETRVSTFPTLFGEKCVIRLFAGSNRFRYVDDLGFSASLAAALKTMLERRGGVILITGGLTFLPSLALGPIVEHFLMHSSAPLF